MTNVPSFVIRHFGSGRLPRYHMYFVDLTLATPTENLALDEALLDGCETGEIRGGVLRIWEPESYFVVLGRSSKPGVEVNELACRMQGVPVLRRVSGGGTVLAGPGCLMYAVVVDATVCDGNRSIPEAHRYVLGRIAAGLAKLVPGVAHVGTSDLAFPGPDGTLVKFSGNSLRMKRSHFVYHGTLLYDFDLPRVGELLAQQTREPEYRAGRSHGEFIANVPLSREAIIQNLIETWQARAPLAWPSGPGSAGGDNQ